MTFKKYRDIILGSLMLVFSGFYLTVAQGIKTRPKLTPAYASAKIVPILLGVLLAILSVICIIEGVYKMKKYGTTMTNMKAGAEQVKGDATQAYEAAKQEAVGQAEAAGKVVEEAADKAEAAAEETKEIILEGPSADTISEVFETEVEEPSPEETEAE